MCDLPCSKCPEILAEGQFKKGNEPDVYQFPILAKPCACASNYVARVPGGNIWVEAVKLVALLVVLQGMTGCAVCHPDCREMSYDQCKNLVQVCARANAIPCDSDNCGKAPR